MPPQGEVARQWFIPGEGIDRHVISTDIQRYLGNDATVRPGVGTEQYQVRFSAALAADFIPLQLCVRALDACALWSPII